MVPAIPVNAATISENLSFADNADPPNTRKITNDPTTIRANMDLTDPCGRPNPFNSISVRFLVLQTEHIGSITSTTSSKMLSAIMRGIISFMVISSNSTIVSSQLMEPPCFHLIGPPNSADFNLEPGADHTPVGMALQARTISPGCSN